MPFRARVMGPATRPTCTEPIGCECRHFLTSQLLQLLSSLNLERLFLRGTRSPWPRVEGAQADRRAAAALDSLLPARTLYPRGQPGSNAFLY